VAVRIGIIGSGPAGLTTALALEKVAADVELTIVDRNQSALDYPGVEYGIQARACRALDRLGVKDAALRTVGHPGQQIILHVMESGRDQKRIRVDPDNTYGVVRPEFLENLSSLLQRTEILRRHDVSEIEPVGRGCVRLTFDSAGAPAREFDIVIACDGANSLARRRYFPHARTFDRGFSAIYLLVEGDPAQPSTPATFAEVANGNASEIVMGTSVTSALFPQGRNRVTIALGFGHPVRDRLWRDHGLSPETPWQAIPAATKSDVAHALARNTPVHDGLMEQALTLVEDWDSPRVYLWAMRDSDPLPHPYAPDCNVVLLGDACHAFLPTIGMGASLAIEDAELLGSRLGRFLHGHGQTSLAAEVFEPWASDRMPVWADLMRRARGAACNWIGEGSRRRFELWPFVPTRIGSAAVRVVEKAMSR
jgi:salicylate hydroxylase